MSQEQQDIALLAYIAVFFYLKALLIMREGWLGRALCWASFVCGLLFTYGVALRFYPEIADEKKVIGGIRVLLVTSLTWAIWQLIHARYLHWKAKGLDPRMIVGRRERVVGRREDVATRREDVVTKREDCMDHAQDT